MKANCLTALGGFVVGGLLSTPFWGDVLFGRGHTQVESAFGVVAILTVSVCMGLLGRLVFWLATAT